MNEQSEAEKSHRVTNYYFHKYTGDVIIMQ